MIAFLILYRTKQKNSLHTIVVIFATSFIFLSCSNNPLYVDVSDIPMSIEIKRFDSAIDSLRINYTDAKLESLQVRYADFFELYNKQIINVGSSYEANYQMNLNAFFSYPIYKDVMKACNKEFADMSEIQDDLTDACKHYKYYFPNFATPQVYTFISGFNQSVVLDSALLGIGLDKYLGVNCDFYKQLGVERYLVATMHPQRIAIDCMRGIAESEFSYTFKEEHLLAKMLHEGRLQYFMKALFPEFQDSLLMGYSSQQMQFCIGYEENMWNYLVEKKLLFNSDHMNIIRFIGKAPFTSPFSKDSPGQTGVWLGYKIVESYMKNNPKTTMKALMEEKDFQKIMNKSRYQP